MNKLYPGYSQHGDIAPQTRKFHDHLIRKQHGRDALAFLAGALFLAVVFLAVMYLR